VNSVLCFFLELNNNFVIEFKKSRIIYLEKRKQYVIFKVEETGGPEENYRLVASH
jgi:hypothetical protein